VRIPDEIRWVFWDVDPAELDPDRDANYILPRILEHGGLAEVRWLIGRFGLERIHAFLRDVGHPELGGRTLAFWRAVFQAEDETWASPPDWRRHKSIPWSA
jgi:hypothetical protein